MATLYVDFTNGNDSNDGTTFANRVKTITNGITAARTAPGDTIRIMKSEDPVSLGVNATFTNKSDTVTLASALTANIDTCETAWTASGGVTTSTSATNREGTNAVTIAKNAGFTGTGVLAYKALGAVTDFSAYTKVSFWIRTNVALSSGYLRFNLCSDTAGATAVNSFTITRALSVTNSWYCLTFDNGAALGNAIQSISLSWSISGPPTGTFILDNILACNALTLTSVISLSSSATAKDFYPIKSINGTTIKLDSGFNNAASVTERGYYGTTATSTCYKVEPIQITSGQITNEAATSSSPSVYSGGWDTTNMTSQTGLTFIDFGVVTSSASAAYLIQIAQGYLNFNNIVCVRSSAGFYVTQSGYNAPFTVSNCAAIGSYYGFWTTFGGYDLDTCIATCCNYGFYLSGPYIVTAANSNSLSCAYGFYSANYGLMALSSCNSHNCGNYGFQSVYGKIRAYNCTAKDNASIGFCSNGWMKLVNCTTSANLTGIVSNGGEIIAHNCTVSDGTSAATTAVSRVSYSNVGGSATTASIYDSNGTSVVAQLVTTPLHGSTSRSWQHIPALSHTAAIPFIQELSPIAVASSGTFTFSIWVQRSSLNVGAKILLRGGQCAGITSDVSASASAAINTWEQLTITANPTQAVPIVIELQSWQISGSGNIYWGDASVSQA